jgi:hypothetical protein
MHEWHGEQHEETATRLAIKLGTLDHHRTKIKHLFGVVVGHGVVFSFPPHYL